MYDTSGSPSSWDKIPRLKDRPPDKRTDETEKSGNNLSSHVSLKNFDTMHKNIEENNSSTSSPHLKSSKDYFKKLGTFFKKNAGSKLFSGSNSDAGSSLGHTNPNLQMSDENNCEIIEKFTSIACSSSTPLPLNQKCTNSSSASGSGSNHSDSNRINVRDLVDKRMAVHPPVPAARERLPKPVASNHISNRPFLPWPNDVVKQKGWVTFLN